ncbi:hydrophobic/amphiphilic exporter-1, HAE1 family/multidrug efflux pump [Hydrobacter penzbergensis]|jgi:hydrophobe/amphiphile efflux-1 (HAE1) family protein|uniref:Hydrophobic/amphiphilic exporter-1, HAE1 family/multidrug efflux pump n=1 Tax=Hydrobacter penzbergensis TaxID=1235997 RepID=A0A8X8IFB9_9BACT|nr:efflux RND transporter permease subunit [Hydrobacter penzbergensis]MBN8720196.1 efflux RND transporter permease subunit [Sediminibacterium magnilacihabitans]PQV59861.1 HAE1 family hydrophobic/amphiphilic exporter-1/multidrug efflux pump [Sediminibacterium magnilacihabitans]SDW69720.1 hydrophobic/amphiphilic exporter-1, HAE1 family/multidrug efflux pump [Hydrobacter penzbergensis]
MNISELSLKRPVLATVMNLLIILFGVVGYSFLAVRDYPAIDPPIITISTNYTGANADIIESQITEPLEKQINGIPGIRTITSSSALGNSQITVEFNLGIDLEAAASDVRDKVGQAQRSLPQDIDAPPVVSKADANSDFILILAVQSRTKSLLELSDYAENVLQQQLQTIKDVSSVNIFGQKRYAMRIWMNPDKMSAHNVAFTDIRTALNTENIELPPGKIYGNNTELIIRALGRLTTEQQFRDLIIKSDSSGIVRLNDVAKVELGPEQLEQAWKYNGVNAVGLAIIPQPGANNIEIADEFDKRLAQIKAANRSDIEFNVLIDNTTIIRRSLSEVKETLMISFGLVVLVIFFFFRNWLIALRPLIDIPISLVATFFIMYIAGFSINILTLLGIVLATGLVVDDGIVVTENIFRKLEEGLPIRKAALEGSREIFFAVISTSITLAVVFLPVIFLQGFVGRLFREFGVTLAAAVLISAFVSLTITPVLNVYLNTKNAHEGWFYKKTEPFFTGMENGYKNLLKAFMRVRWIAWVIVLVCGCMIWWIMKGLQSEIAPLEDRSSVRFSVVAAEGTSYNYMQKLADNLTDYLYDSVPERDFVFARTPSFGGTNTTQPRIGLVDPQLRTRSQNDIANDLQKKLSRFNQMRVFAIQEQTISVGLGSRGSLPVQFILQNQDINKLREIIPKFLDEVRKDKTFSNADVNLKFNRPEVQLTVDRMKIKDLGLSTADVVSAIQAAFSGGRMAYFIMNGYQYQVIGQVDRGNRDNPNDIRNLYVKNNKGKSIPLDAVVHLEQSSNPSTLYHFNRYKAATISASLAEGKTIGDGINAMNAIAGKLLDQSFQTSLSGPSRDYSESSSNIVFAFILALILIYLVLSAQFESFLDPLTIMITVPLALAGALLSLFVFKQTLNIFSEIGMIMLIGLVTKNGILIVEFANQKRANGLPKMQAVVEAATQRLRPIIMTSLATSLGALPIALSLGAASTSRIPLGIVVVGGILFSLILTLFVIPAVYTFISGKHKARSVDITE